MSNTRKRAIIKPVAPGLTASDMKRLAALGRTAQVKWAIFRWSIVLGAIGTAVGTLVVIPLLLSAHRDAQRFDAAPVCQADATSSTDCVVSTTAHVDAVTVAENTGKGAKCHHTDVAFSAPGVSPQMVRGDRDNDRSADIHEGDSIPVSVWRGEIVGDTLSDSAEITPLNPMRSRSANSWPRRRWPSSLRSPTARWPPRSSAASSL